MNIGMLHDSITELTGGSSMSTLRFSELLVERGHKIIFLTSESHKKKQSRYYISPKGYKIKEYIFNSIPLQEQLGRHFSLAIPSFKELEEIFKREKIEIVHIMLPFFAAYRALLVARKMGIKVVYTSHMEPENFFSQIHKSLNQKRLINLFYKFLISSYKKGDAVICPTKYSQKAIKKQEKKLKTVVITNGVNLRDFRKVNPSPFFEKFKQNKKDPRILYQGRIDIEKNIETLVKSTPHIMKVFPNVKIDINGDGIAFEKIKKLVKKMKLEKNVNLWGRVPNNKSVYSYNATDIFVLPSIAEIEGMVVLEAIACGKPILIANSKKNAASSFIDGNGFTFETLDPEDLAKKAIKILENQKLKERMSKNSLRLAKKLDIDKSVISLEKTYIKVLKEKPQLLKPESKEEKILAYKIIKLIAKFKIPGLNLNKLVYQNFKQIILYMKKSYFNGTTVKKHNKNKKSFFLKKLFRR
jgi:glycosyltransferase involved in cell wall biosynthesis